MYKHKHGKFCLGVLTYYIKIYGNCLVKDVIDLKRNPR